MVVDDLSAGKLSNLAELDITIIPNKVEDVLIEDLEAIDVIIHLAAQSSVPLSKENFYKSSSNNLLSSIKVFDIAKELSLPVLYASSSAVYGNLQIGDDVSNNYDILTPYALDKLTLEAYARLSNELYSVPSIGFRFFNVYGPYQDPSNPYSGVISLFLSQSLKCEELKVFGGNQTRDFIHVVNICEIIEIAIKKLLDPTYTSAESLNLGTGNSISILNLAHKIKDIVNSKSPVKLLPEVVGDPKQSDGVYNKLRTTLEIQNYEFLKLEDGLITVKDWMKKDI